MITKFEPIAHIVGIVQEGEAATISPLLILLNVSFSYPARMNIAPAWNLPLCH